jgi:metallophosphoesterase superfamily enzyme
MRYCKDWFLLPQRFVVHEPTATAVLADVHLGYSATRQRLGDAVPCRSVMEEMQPLAQAATGVEIRALVVAGDLFERGFHDDLYQQFLVVLEGLEIRFLGLVPGNHDRGIGKAPGDLPLLPQGFDLAGWHIHHGDRPPEHTHAVMGHWHPALRWKRRKVPCFLARDNQLILPAFSLDAAGADIRSDPRWRGWDCHAILGNEVARASHGVRTSSQW